MSNRRKLKRSERPRHVCSDGVYPIRGECREPSCGYTEELSLCGVGLGEYLHERGVWIDADCPACEGDGTFRIRLGREWLGEPRLLWECDNDCTPSALRAALLARGIDASHLGDYGLECPTALYRWWDDADLLLYIGISDELAGRVKGHVKGSSWMDFAARSAIERYPSRAAALDAEEAAIKSEHPLFNHQHNNTPEAQMRLVEYLIKHGRTDLLAPAVSRG